MASLQRQTIKPEKINVVVPKQVLAIGRIRRQNAKDLLPAGTTERAKKELQQNWRRGAEA